MRTKTLVALMATTVMVGLAACSPTRTQRAPGEHVDDAVLLTSVKSALASNPTTEAREINVDVNRGVVSLNGFVDTEKEKREAGQVARNVDGVQDVKNNLAVQEGSRTPGEVIDDATLTAKVKAELIKNDQTKAHQINVDTVEGVVQLSGFVDSEAAKSAAVQVARSVTGVKDVKNELTVKSY
jgi:hyperosmotically inducible periplasmic protein